MLSATPLRELLLLRGERKDGGGGGVWWWGAGWVSGGGGGVGGEMGEENKQFNHCGRNGMRVADIFGRCYSDSRERAHKERR